MSRHASALPALLGVALLLASPARADAPATRLFASVGMGGNNIGIAAHGLAGLHRGPFWIGGSAISGGELELFGDARTEYAALAGVERHGNERGLRVGVGVARLAATESNGFLTSSANESWTATGPAFHVGGWLRGRSWSRLGVHAHGSFTNRGSFFGVAITWGIDLGVLN
ncbi:MAG: hypothetical protein ACYDIE_10320 [Candidatus Krumholzibacteriia bacterium]